MQNLRFQNANSYGRLTKMVSACPHVFHNFEKHLFKAIFLVAYHGFFRIGVLLLCDKGKVIKVVQLEDVEFHKHVLYIHLRFHKNKKIPQKAPFLN